MVRAVPSPLATALKSVSVVAIALIAASAIGCGGDDGAKCVKALCDPATFGQVCLGHAVQSCAADGKSYVFTACSDQQRCAANVAAASCVPRACTTLGQTTCASVTSIARCADDGSATETIACSSGDVCKDGACVPSTCTDEKDVCSDHGLLTCTDAAWVQTNCPVTQLCTVGDSGVARCNPAACTPEARVCDGANVRVCDARGATETVVACAKGEVCLAGVCQASVCGGSSGADASDASDTSDAGDATDTSEPESTIVFTLNGVVSTYDISAFAQFDAGDREVTVTASKGTKKIELRLAPAGQTVSGSFKSDVFNPIKAVVCYDSGGTPASFEDCPGFTHHAVAYDVEITQNDGEGGRFIGTFTATLQDVNTDPIEILGGQINVKFR